MRRLTLLAALATALVGCGSDSPPSGVSIRIDENPFRVALLRDGKTVVAEDRDARLRYQLVSTGEQHKLTRVLSHHGDVYRVATDEPGRTATVTVTRRADGYRISLQLHPTTDVQQVIDSFDTRPDEHFLGGGESGNAVDLRGQILSEKVSYQCTYAAVPFFASSAGWGLRLASRNVSAFAFPGSQGGTGCRFGDEPSCSFTALSDRMELCLRGARLDEDLYAGDLPELERDYQADAGKPVVPPPSELALMKWRDAVSSPAEVLDDIARLRGAGIPIGWVILDNPWETCIGTLAFDRSRIPDPARLIEQVHRRGVRFMLWVSPKVVCGEGYPPSALLGDPGSQTLDLRRPAVRAEFRARLHRLFALGVDGVKGDRADEVDLEGTDESLQNEYPLLFQSAVAAELPRGGAAIFRAATAGSQSVVPGIWAGDQPGDFVGLQRAIRAGETAAMSGFPVWGSDVGGYASQDLTPEVFARWAQLGAVSPVLEVGGIGPNATPWTLGPAAMDALRGAATLHYELFPYLYGLLRAREPVLRPLGYAFPGDPAAWSAELEFEVGPDLLAAPVTGGGTTPSVYLPAGSWIDLYTGARVDGGRTFTRPTPLTEFPLYVRAGAVLPFNLRTATDPWWGADEFSHPGRAGWLATDGVHLDLRAAPRSVQLFVPAPSRPSQVTLGGHRVAFVWTAGPLPGVVVRVHGPTVHGELRLG